MSLYYVKTWRYPQNRKYLTYHIAIRGGHNNSHSNLYRKFSEISTCVFWDVWADRQTYWSQYFAHLLDAK